MKKILITGGSGFVGQEVIKKALQGGYLVTYLSRHEGRGEIFKNPKLKYIQADLLSGQSIYLSETVDLIIHLVGAIKVHELERLNYQAMQGVIRLAKDNQIERILYLTAKVGYPSYLKSKRQSEELLISSGLFYGILSSGLIYGSKRPLANLLGQLSCQMIHFPFIDNLVVKLGAIPVEEVAISLLEHAKNDCQSYQENLRPAYAIKKE
ncbi:SDR family oxidoreductase [Streptococcus hongkongensis]|nr:NAD-dependent dehydratase [Streptococcus uberis]